MRLTTLLTLPTWLKVAALCTLLSGCFAPMLAMGQNQLMWSLIKPLVGLDPSSTQLFERPMIKNRMTALLGDDYDTTLALLRTAPKLQQEGTLFYLASPLTQADGKGAGFVWNAQTNQMAAVLNDGEQTKLFTEPDSTDPVVWPQDIQGLLTPGSVTPAPSNSLLSNASQPKSGLTSALSAGIKAAIGSKATAVMAQPNALEQELSATQQQLKDAQAQLKALQSQSESVSDMKEKVKEKAQTKVADQVAAEPVADAKAKLKTLAEAAPATKVKALTEAAPATKVKALTEAAPATKVKALTEAAPADAKAKAKAKIEAVSQEAATAVMPNAASKAAPKQASDAEKSA